MSCNKLHEDPDTRRVTSYVVFPGHSSSEVSLNEYPQLHHQATKPSNLASPEHRRRVRFYLGTSDHEVKVAEDPNVDKDSVTPLSILHSKRPPDSLCGILNNNPKRVSRMTGEIQKSLKVPSFTGVSRADKNLKRNRPEQLDAYRCGSNTSAADPNHSGTTELTLAETKAFDMGSGSECLASGGCEPLPDKELECGEGDSVYFCDKPPPSSEKTPDQPLLHHDRSLLANDDHHLLSRVIHMGHVISHGLRRANSTKLRGREKNGASQRKQELGRDGQAISYATDDDSEEDLSQVDKKEQFFPHSFADESCLTRGDSFLRRYFPRIHNSTNNHSSTTHGKHHPSIKAHHPEINHASNSIMHNHNNHHSLREHVLEVLHAPHRFRRTRKGFSQLTIR